MEVSFDSRFVNRDGFAPEVTYCSLHVPRHGWQLNHDAIYILTHLDLTAETRCFRESKGKVQHVILEHD